jgi:hypothetical protein
LNILAPVQAYLVAESWLSPVLSLFPAEPAVLPYELGTPAAFDFAGFNGRGLTDDVMDIILTLSSNKALADGVAPNKARVRTGFPYFGEPYSKDEQAGLIPAAPPKK